VKVLVVFGGLLFAACAHRPTPISMPDYDPGPDEVVVTRRPASVYFEPELVPYPGMGVSYVANVAEETYQYEERFYCFLGGRWFKAATMGGPWDALSMKYVPVAIYRVRGHLPPALDDKARAAHKATEVSLVSFQLLPSE
jgi:hypothetical protein